MSNSEDCCNTLDRSYAISGLMASSIFNAASSHRTGMMRQSIFAEAKYLLNLMHAHRCFKFAAITLTDIGIDLPE